MSEREPATAKPIRAHEVATGRPVVPAQKSVRCECGSMVICAGTGLLAGFRCDCGRKIPPAMTVEAYNAEVMRLMKGKKCRVD